MPNGRLRRLATVCLAALLLAGATSRAVDARHRPGVGVHHLPTNAKNPAFVFGTTDTVRPPPSRVTIYAGGRVQVKGGLSVQVVERVHLSRSSLRALLKIAEAYHFFTLPEVIPATPTPDVSSLFITIYTTSGPYGVTEVPTDQPTAANRDFDRLFLILEWAAGMAP